MTHSNSAECHCIGNDFVVVGKINFAWKTLKGSGDRLLTKGNVMSTHAYSNSLSRLQLTSLRRRKGIWRHCR